MASSNGRKPKQQTQEPSEESPQFTDSSTSYQDGEGPPGFGNRQVMVDDHQPQRPTTNILDAFTKFAPVPEEAWMKAGLSRRELARKRRIIANFNYVMLGVTDVMGDQFIDLAGHAGLDDRAMKRAETVATHMPQPSAYDRFSDHYGPQRPNTYDRR